MSDFPESPHIIRRRLRADLGLSRTELARFLGVSEATVVRWESDRSVSEPKGLQAVIFGALSDASRKQPKETIAGLVRSSGRNHRDALKKLLQATD